MSTPDQSALEAAELATEQAYVDGVYVQLERSTRNAQELAKEGHGRGKLGHEGGLVERDAMVFQAAKRIATLNAAHDGLVFGRLDLADRAEPPRYIGRIGLRDQNHDTLLVDWRAPAAAVFYQATPNAPLGVARRRVLRCQGEEVIGIEDDLIDAEAAGDLPIMGEGALMAQLSRARDRSMHSIVATIQAEQDKAIRAPSKGVVHISGGPGTGKTVVALHRAAYLLYTDRDRYERGGVLVVGPSGVFMRYIERVLPSLGETAVALRSLGEVVDGVTARRHDVAAVADVKGGEAMVELLRRLARQAVPGAPREFRIFYRDNNLILTSRDLNHLRRQLLSQGKRNAVINRVPGTLTDALWRKVKGDRARQPGKQAFVETVRDDPHFAEFVTRWWPALEATQVLGWLREADLVTRLAEGVLSQADAVTLRGQFHTEPTVADVALLDELRYLLGDPPEREPQDDDPLAFLSHENFPEVTTISERAFSRPTLTSRTDDDNYAHVLIDEAQDLTPMQWRMVGRRGKVATWTIVGDPAQSSWPVPEQADRAREAALGDKPRHRFHLGTNYRNSREIYQYAADYARRVGLNADLPDAVRRTGVEPRRRPCIAHELRPSLEASVTELLDDVAGTVAVVVPVERLAQVRAWLSDVDRFALHLQGGDQARLVVLTGWETKGLEFDGIVVLAPEEIESESSTGRATLYVVLTRATQRLIELTMKGN